MTLAEDLLLLLIDDDTGRPVTDGTTLDHALAGALLVELALLGRVGVADGGGAVKKGRLDVLDAAPTGDALLDAALATLAERAGREPKAVLEPLAKGLRDRALDRLVERGLLRREEGTVLLVFPTKRYPAADGAHERDVRERIRSVLEVGATPDERTAATIALLVAIGAVPKVVRPDDRDARRAVQQRAKAIAEGAWAADAVKQAIDDISLAVAFMGAGVAVIGGSSAVSS